MELFYENIKDKDIVWACAFEKANSRSDRLLANLHPSMCLVVKKNKYRRCIIPYSKKGNLLKSKEKSINNEIVFFDNKEECVKYYNDKIIGRINELTYQINKLQSLIVKI